MSYKYRIIIINQVLIILYSISIAEKSKMFRKLYV